MHLHGVGDGGVTVVSGGGSGSGANVSASSAAAQTIGFVSVDSVLVSVGPADPFPTPLVAPDIAGGVHFALVGNIWNTNYPFCELLCSPYHHASRSLTSLVRFALCLVCFRVPICWRRGPLIEISLRDFHTNGAHVTNVINLGGGRWRVGRGSLKGAGLFLSRLVPVPGTAIEPGCD